MMNGSQDVVHMKEVADQLFEEVRLEYQKESCLSGELLSALGFIFQAPLLPALDIIDRKNISKLTCPAGRVVYQVIGSSGTPYTCLQFNDLCTCMAYRFSVLQRREVILCKHVLAVRLCEAMGLCKQEQVSDSHLADIILQMD